MKGKTGHHEGRHKAKGGEVTYEGQGSHVEEEAKEKKHGGRAKRKHGGRTEGHKAKRRMDRPGRKRGGRAGADMRPLTTASKVTDAGAHKSETGDADGRNNDEPVGP